MSRSRYYPGARIRVLHCEDTYKGWAESWSPSGLRFVKRLEYRHNRRVGKRVVAKLVSEMLDDREVLAFEAWEELEDFRNSQSERLMDLWEDEERSYSDYDDYDWDMRDLDYYPPSWLSDEYRRPEPEPDASSEPYGLMPRHALAELEDRDMMDRLEVERDDLDALHDLLNVDPEENLFAGAADLMPVREDWDLSTHLRRRLEYKGARR